MATLQTLELFGVVDGQIVVDNCHGFIAELRWKFGMKFSLFSLVLSQDLDFKKLLWSCKVAAIINKS